MFDEDRVGDGSDDEGVSDGRGGESRVNGRFDEDRIRDGGVDEGVGEGSDVENKV